MNRSQPSSPSRFLNNGVFPSLNFASLCGLAALLCALAASPKAQAYSFEAGSPRWSAGNVTFVLSLGDPGRTLIDGSTSWNTSASAALSIWNQYMGTLQLSGVTNDNAPVSNHDGVNSIAFASTFFGSSFGSNTLAITGYYYSSGARMTEANVLVNNHLSWDAYRGALRFNSGWDLRRVLIHEIGHALGLDHPDDHGQNVNAVMNSIISNADTAMPDDINGIQAIYGSGSGGGSTPTPTPAPTATPAPTPNPTVPPTSRSVTLTADTRFLHVGQTATFTVSISSPSSSPVTVNFITGGTARANMYSLSGPPQVTIPGGASSADFTLTATSAPRRGRKAATIFLLNGAGYTVGFPRNASVTIAR